LAYLRDHSAEAIIMDLLLPGLACHKVIEAVRGDPEHEDICVLVRGSSPEGGARCIAAGADDYLFKDLDPALISARLTASVARRRRRMDRESLLRELLESRRLLDRELSEAACYVRGLLPPRLLERRLSIDWSFIPSSNLGGDIFGYHRLPGGELALYLVDVSGHGIEAALLSVTIVNALRNGSLAGADFLDPASVLSRLNRAFPTEEQNNMFFTIWYGVLDEGRGVLRYSTAGAVPALLLRGHPAPQDPELLGTEGAAAGVDEDADYRTKSLVLDEGCRLFLFSDGLFETRGSDGRMMNFGDFLRSFKDLGAEKGPLLKTLLERARARTATGRFEDDVSFLELRFGQG